MEDMMGTIRAGNIGEPEVWRIYEPFPEHAPAEPAPAPEPAEPVKEPAPA
jgi:hypothetical protein